MEFITKLVTTKLIGYAFDKAVSALEKQELTNSSSMDGLTDAIESHIKHIEAWTSSLSFRENHTSKSTLNVYVKLGFYLNRRRSYFSNPKRASGIEITEAIENSNAHVVILGQPGSGKTTSIKYVAQLLIKDEFYCADKCKFPIVVRLRELGDNTLFSYLETMLGFDIKTRKKNNFDVSKLSELKIQVLSEYLDSLQALIIFDGLDEVGYREKRTDIYKEINYFNRFLNKAKTITTCRTADFQYHLENADVYELASLSDQQIREFTEKWLGSSKQADTLFHEIKKSPFYDTAMRPLTLAHLCAIFEREARIPEKPKTVYKLTVELLLKEWDLQRGIHRSSRYAGFEVDRKFEFLSRLSLELCKNKYKINFSSSNLISSYYNIYSAFKLPSNEAQQVVDEIESHNGLVLQASYDKYEFAHKSIQEFLVADCILRMPVIPVNKYAFDEMPNEFAICVSMSSSPIDYFLYLVFNVWKDMNIDEGFLKSFINRIVLEGPDIEASSGLGLALAFLCSEKTKTKYLDELLEHRIFRESFNTAGNYYIRTHEKEYLAMNTATEKFGIVFKKTDGMNQTELFNNMPDKLVLSKGFIRNFPLWGDNK